MILEQGRSGPATSRVAGVCCWSASRVKFLRKVREVTALSIYPSHQLRFSIIRPEETVENFHARISAAADSDPDLDIETTGDSAYWTLGSQARSKGSLHSDIWKGSAQQLASSNTIAIYPVIGWWRERSHLQKANKSCRYSLIVSIHTPDEAIDLYVPVAAQVGIPISTSIQ